MLRRHDHRAAQLLRTPSGGSARPVSETVTGLQLGGGHPAFRQRRRRQSPALCQAGSWLCRWVPGSVCAQDLVPLTRPLTHRAILGARVSLVHTTFGLTLRSAMLAPGRGALSRGSEWSLPSPARGSLCSQLRRPQAPGARL